MEMLGRPAVLVRSVDGSTPSARAGLCNVEVRVPDTIDQP